MQRLQPDAGNIESHVMPFLRNLDCHCASIFAGELSTAGKTRVRSFETFDGEYGAIFDDNELTDVEA